MKRLALVLALALAPVLLPALAAPALAQEGAEPVPLEEPAAGPALSDDAVIDALTQDVSSGLRCPVCQGLSVNDSPADGARAMKARIRELVAMGYSQEQIEDYFVDRYGIWVLLAPPARGRHWAVYVAPLGFLALGGLLLAVRAVGRVEEEAVAEAGDRDARAQAEHDALEPYRQRVLVELAERPGS